MDESKGPAPRQLDNLPLELKVHVLSYLAKKDLTAIRLVSTGWKDIVNGSGLIEFNVKVSDSNVQDFKEMSLGTMAGIKSLYVADLKNTLAPFGTELKKLLSTTEKISFGIGSTTLTPNTPAVRGEDVVAILKACQNVKELEFGAQFLNGIPNEFPLLLKRIRLEILNIFSITFSLEKDTTVLLGILQLNAPSLREFRGTRITACNLSDWFFLFLKCPERASYFGKDLYYGIWKFIARHAESLKILILKNIGSFDYLCDLGAEINLRPKGHHTNSIRNLCVKRRRIQELEQKFETKELDSDDQSIIQRMQLLKLNSMLITQQDCQKKTHDARFLKELFHQTQVGLQVLKFNITPPTLRSLMLENIPLNKNTLVELQIEFEVKLVKGQSLKKYCEELKCLKIFKLGGNVTFEDFTFLPKTITSLTIDTSNSIQVQDFKGICLQLVNLEDLTLRPIRPSLEESLQPILYFQFMKSLHKLKRLHVDATNMGIPIDSIHELCEADPELSYTVLNRWTPITRTHHERNAVIQIQRA